MMKKNIAVVFGGNSSESVVSVKSSKTITKYLPSDKYNVFPVLIKGDEWNFCTDDGGYIAVNKNDFSIKYGGCKVNFDYAFIIIHGTPGENGILQAYFDLVGIPYNTCNSFVSALTFNKYACKCYLRDCGVNMANDILLKKNEQISAEFAVKKLGLPIFVKPNAGGSSFGVTKLKSVEDLSDALKSALEEDQEVIMESFIKGREFSHGLFITDKRLINLPVTEIISKNDFFDYEAKYTDGLSEEVTPADIPQELTERIKQTSEKIAKRLDCRGLVRVDYIYQNNEFFFLEINIVPGMSEQSIIPKQIKEAGLCLSETLDLLIQDTISA